MAFFIDAHCDSAVVLKPRELLYGAGGHVDFLRLLPYHKVQVFAFFLNQQQYPTFLLEEMLERVAVFKNTVHQADYCEFLLKKRDLAKSKLLLLMSLEGVDALCGRPELADIFFDIGFRAMGLTWNNDNWAAGGCGGNNNGLTAKGQLLIERLNSLGMMVDLAHASPQTFAEVLACSRKPVMVSHSCCFRLHPHRRNLTDAQLHLLGEKEGVCGITFYPDFLTGGEATVEDIAEHIHHAVIQAGLEHVGLGSDFDGIDTLPVGMRGVQDFPYLADALIKKGYTEAATEKIMGGNWYAFFKENLPY